VAASRRRRRILWTAGLLAWTAIAGTVAGIAVYRANRPQEYEPGEASADITRVTERPVAVAPSRRQTVARKSDPLADPGKALPAGAPEPRFTDVTVAAGLGDFRTFAGERTSQLPEDMGSGAAWGDYDNDGWDDLFLVGAGGGAPSALYHNQGDGTFRRVESFPETRITGMGAAWGDYDADGWLDLIVTGIDTLLLFHNDHGTFRRDARFGSLKGFWTGAAWGDYNRDGRLDLYICGYVRYTFDRARAMESSRQFGLEVPFTLNPASFPAERNLLFRNNGDGTFTEVARQLGVDNPQGRSLSALWHDFDGDGWPDLYVANDISENKLYLNRGGRFSDAGSAAWVSEYRGSMGLAAGDFDRDGDDDLFISHWIAQQFALYQSLLAEQSKSAAGAPLHFTDVAEIKGIGQPSLQSIGWGASFADFDSDGWLDLAVANGSTFETRQPPRRLVAMPSFLFWNARGEYFYDLAPWNRSLAQAHVSRGLAVADYDNDGALDLLIVDRDAGVRLLRNDMPHGNWIELRLGGRSDGATVIAHAGGAALRRTVSSASYLSQDSRRVHIGLGEQTRVDQLEVRWPDGRSEVWNALDANRIWDLSQGESGPSPVDTAHSTRLFWAKQRAAMDAMKREHNLARAVRLFREALALDPHHEDSRYYLANCLALEGDRAGALAELDALIRINPQSHRAYQQRGVLLASGARSKSDLAQAEAALKQALRINPEETGTLLLLGETALLRGDLDTARQRFEWVCRSNPRSAPGLFLEGFTAWKRKEAARAAQFLRLAAKARGPDWKPKGSALEGDVARRMHAEGALLARFWEQWDGRPDPSAAFGRLDAFLQSR